MKEAGPLAARLDGFAAALTTWPEADAEPARVFEVIRLADQAMRHVLAATGGKLDPAWARSTEAIDRATAAAFDRARQRDAGTDLRPFQAYAEYVLARDQRVRCMEVVAQGLKTPAATVPAWVPAAMGLRELGIKAALADAGDADRFAKAAPWIAELLASATPRFQALGHLFQGVIELEQGGMPEATAAAGGLAAPATPGRDRAASALDHLKAAAEGLPDVPTAQALYGVALVLNRDASLGRQYLQQAQRLGGEALDPRYQVWAAWSAIQAEYPEVAEPIVDRLLAEVGSARVGDDMRPTLHLLRAEVLVAKGTREALAAARGEYQQAVASGHPMTPALKLRLARLEAQAGDDAAALRAFDALATDAEAGPEAAQLAVLTLRDRGQGPAATARLAKARSTYPDDPELAGLDAILRAEAGKAADAEALLAEFLKAHPGHEELGLLRARLLAADLDRPDDARALLAAMGAASTRSTPLVHLANLEIEEQRFDAAAKVVAQIRARWSEMSAADLLDAQLALARGRADVAAGHLEAALKKDPQNKVALYWKARLDEATGSPEEAQRTFEAIVRERSTKELDEGIDLTSAAQWALATMALQRQEYEVAASRFEALAKEARSASVARSARWSLARARAGQGDVARARADVAELLADPKTRPDERVQAAEFLRRLGDVAGADAQVQKVLAAEPAHPAAVTWMALSLRDRGKTAEARALAERALDAGPAPSNLALVAAALQNNDGPDGPARALATLETALAATPDDADLLRARYQVMALSKNPRAIAALEEAAAARPDGPAWSVLVEAYRDQGQLDAARDLLARRLAAAPAGSTQAAELRVRLIELEVAAITPALARGDAAAAKAASGRAAARLAEARKAHPEDNRFLELDGERALALGEFTQAGQIARRLTDASKNSPAGPLLTARVAAAQGRPDEAARAYAQAVERTPGRPELVVAQGRAELAAGHPDAAVRLASNVLQAERDLPAALVLQAQGLVRQPGADAEARRTQAAALLQKAIAGDPTNAEARHLLSDLLVARGDRAGAITQLEACLKAQPGDDTALALLVQRLTEPATPGRPADPASLDRAARVAKTAAERDPSGVLSLAAAVGFHRAGRSDLAAPWAEAAAKALDKPVVHLTYGDILLAQGEAAGSPESARPIFEKAVACYDRALAERPDSIEAANNKAWILHRYLGRDLEALGVAKAVADRMDRATLPPDFLDTLGAIQAALGQTSEARATFEAGLRKVPDHAVLNFHMGRLLAGQPGEAARARAHLESARKAADPLPPALAAEADHLLAGLAR